jgi:hypothetical protein
MKDKINAFIDDMNETGRKAAIIGASIAYLIIVFA